MNANERNEIVKLIQPNILPNAVELEVKVTEDEKVIEELRTLDYSSDGYRHHRWSIYGSRGLDV